MKFDFAVVGGDRRLEYLADILRGDGYSVLSVGREKLADMNGVLGDIKGADTVVLPLPTEVGDGRLNAPFADEELYVGDVIKHIGREQNVLGGKMSDKLKMALYLLNIRCGDYFTLESFTEKNAEITAEGAVSLAMQHIDKTIAGSRCLVTGYGRIGARLAKLLRELGADVCVAARREDARRAARAMGCSACGFDAPENCAGAREIIFNTVPSNIFDADALSVFGGNCLYIELASPPYGVDICKVRGNERFVLAEGLPGKYAPKSAAGAIAEAVYNILKERGGDK